VFTGSCSFSDLNLPKVEEVSRDFAPDFPMVYPTSHWLDSISEVDITNLRWLIKYTMALELVDALFFASQRS
jgi:hypothetical protein